jgi:hypothetical protein
MSFGAKKLSIINLVWSVKNFKCETFTDEWLWGWMTNLEIFVEWMVLMRGTRVQELLQGLRQYPAQGRLTEAVPHANVGPQLKTAPHKTTTFINIFTTSLWLKDGTYSKEPGDNFLAPHLRRVVERRKVQIVPLVDHPVQRGNINIEEEYMDKIF